MSAPGSGLKLNRSKRGLRRHQSSFHRTVAIWRFRDSQDFLEVS
jgi:hypothetical protein